MDTDRSRSVNETRRIFIASLATMALGATAGCFSILTDNSPSYPNLSRTTTYLSDEVELSLPDDLPVVTNPDDAELIILPDETAVDVTQVVDWLSVGRIIALIGKEGRPTAIDWAETEVYENQIGEITYPESDQKYQLTIILNHRCYTTGITSRGSPTDTDADLLGGLDSSLDGIRRDRKGFDVRNESITYYGNCTVFPAEQSQRSQSG